MSLKDFAKKPIRFVRDGAAELLRRLPVSSQTIGPPKDEDTSFSCFLKRASPWVRRSKERVMFPSEAVELPGATGVFGPTTPRFLDPGRYEADPGVLYECPEARVFNSPHAIISPDDHLFAFASSWHSPKPRSHFAFHHIRLGKIRRLAGKTLHFGGSSNIWHFYADNLYKALLLERVDCRFADYDHIIGKKPDTPVERRFYDALGIPLAKLVDPERHRHLKCDHLTFFPTASNRRGRWLPNLLCEFILRTAGIQRSSEQKRRLYISRNRAAFRKVLNESTLIDWLVPRGFEVLHLEELTPDEQITAFRDAEIVVGGHGAGLSHILFSRPGTALIELRNLSFQPINGVSDCFRVFCGLLGIRYYAVTTLDTENPSDAHKSNLRFALGDLQAAVAAAEGRL